MLRRCRGVTRSYRYCYPFFPYNSRNCWTLRNSLVLLKVIIITSNTFGKRSFRPRQIKRKSYAICRRQQRLWWFRLGKARTRITAKVLIWNWDLWVYENIRFAVCTRTSVITPTSSNRIETKHRKINRITTGNHIKRESLKFYFRSAFTRLPFVRVPSYSIPAFLAVSIAEPPLDVFTINNRRATTYHPNWQV